MPTHPSPDRETPACSASESGPGRRLALLLCKSNPNGGFPALTESNDTQMSEFSGLWARPEGFEPPTLGSEVLIEAKVKIEETCGEIAIRPNV